MLRLLLRPRWVVGHVLAVVAFLTCLRLGWWQWSVTESARGSAQNLGYALLWPVFGVAFVYMWVRFLKLELIKEDEESDRQAADLGGDVLAGHAGGLMPADGWPDVDPAAGVPVGGRRVDATAVDRVPAPEAAPDAAGDPPSRGAEAVSADGEQPRQPARPKQRESRAVTVAIAEVGGDEEDPEMYAYNQFLAALAEEDRRRAR